MANNLASTVLSVVFAAVLGMYVAGALLPGAFESWTTANMTQYVPSGAEPLIDFVVIAVLLTIVVIFLRPVLSETDRI
jgi:hypothetical protein